MISFHPRVGDSWDSSHSYSFSFCALVVTQAEVGRMSNDIIRLLTIHWVTYRRLYILVEAAVVVL